MATGDNKTASRHHRLGPIDAKWPEVKFINDHAVFMGYLSMAVTGTGILVLTWSTVVLLGGFVTLLAKEDFWSLTVITLVQTRVFDVFLNGAINNIGYSFTRLQEAALSVALPQKNQYRLCSKRGMVRLLVFTILLCPLFGLYMFGLFVSPWISLWRLCRTIGGHGHMFGEKANLKPALVILYSLAVLQGVLFYYWAISASEEKSLVRRVAEAYELAEDDKARGSVSDYLREIRTGCERNPSYARGRNLITYAVDLMESNCPGNYLSGARILDTLIRQQNHPEQRRRTRICDMVASASSASNAGTSVTFRVVNLPESVVVSQRILVNNMIGFGSSCDTIKILVQMLDSKGQDDGEISEMRCRAMRIVAHFASEIRLDKIMYGVKNISSLLEHRGYSEQSQGSDSEGSKSEGWDSEKYQMYFTGLKIFTELAKDEDNFRVMSNTDGITKKIVTVIVNCNELHEEKHDEWLSIAQPGMLLINQFVSASSKSSNVPHLREIQELGNGINTLQTMLDCQKCKRDDALRKSAILALTQVMSMPDDANNMDELRETFIKSLVVMFLHGSDQSPFKKLAGESLVQLSLTSEANAKSILSAEDGIVDTLTKFLRNDKNKYRKSAADILKHLCTHYKSEDKNFENLKEAMIREIPEVLKDVLLLGSPPRVQEASASLCAIVHERLVAPCPELNDQFNEKASTICQEIHKDREAVSFTDLLSEAKQVVEDRKKRLVSRFSFFDDDDEARSGCCIS